MKVVFRRTFDFIAQSPYSCDTKDTVYTTHRMVCGVRGSTLLQVMKK
jgi:hypothetical protein